MAYEIDFGEPVAQYTKLYKDSAVPTAIVSHFSSWDTSFTDPVQGTMSAGTFLAGILLSKYRYYENYTTDDGIMQKSIEDTFDIWVDYFDRKLKLYVTEINMFQSRIDNYTKNYIGKQVMDEDTSLTHGESITKTDDEHERQITHYDLPRTTTTQNYPSQKDIIHDPQHIVTDAHSGIDTNARDYTRDDSSTEVVSRSGVDDAIKGKKELLALVMNLFNDFAIKFRKCFMEVYA